MKKIPLTKNKFALIDNTDFNQVSKIKWQVNNSGYAIHNMKKGRIFMHNFIMQPLIGMQVDHINNNPLDNRRENLRIVTPQQNALNHKRQKNNTSGYKGVDKQTSGWRARITINGKLKFIGYFKELRYAAMAYDIWAKELHGEYASLNFKQAGLLKNIKN